MIPSRSMKKVCGGPRTFQAAPIDRSGSVTVGQVAALLGDEGARGLGVVLVERADDDEARAGVALRGGLEERELLAAGPAPAGPEVDEDGRSPLRRQVEGRAVERRARQGRARACRSGASR